MQISGTESWYPAGRHIYMDTSHKDTVVEPTAENPKPPIPTPLDGVRGDTSSHPEDLASKNPDDLRQAPGPACFLIPACFSASVLSWVYYKLFCMLQDSSTPAYGPEYQVVLWPSFLQWPNRSQTVRGTRGQTSACLRLSEDLGSAYSIDWGLASIRGAISPT